MSKWFKVVTKAMVAVGYIFIQLFIQMSNNVKIANII